MVAVQLPTARRHPFFEIHLLQRCEKPGWTCRSLEKLHGHVQLSVVSTSRVSLKLILAIPVVSAFPFCHFAEFPADVCTYQKELGVSTWNSMSSILLRDRRVTDSSWSQRLVTM